MRLIVFFDLPTLTKKDRHAANKFRKFLIDDGYIMLQLSIYSRICKGADTIDKHIKRLQTSVPEYGHIRLLVVTEKQYASMHILIGKPKKTENIGIMAFLDL